jgi:hypothetical protein
MDVYEEGARGGDIDLLSPPKADCHGLRAPKYPDQHERGDAEQEAASGGRDGGRERDLDAALDRPRLGEHGQRTHVSLVFRVR